MVTIFDYTDFRLYLNDFYLDKKRFNSSFSYQVFADKCGFNSKGSIHSIISGKRNLSSAGVYKVTRALELNAHETQYFEHLVAFDQCRTNREKKHYFERICRTLSRFRSKSQLSQHVLCQQQYEFYSRWYHVMVRTVIDLFEFRGDFKWLASMIYPRISAKQAKQSVELLERLELIKKDKDGLYRISHKDLATGKEVLSLAVANFHKECIDLAGDALNSVPPEHRNFSGLTLGISHNAYKKILSELSEFQQTILKIASEDEESDRVYHFNFHLFPTSKYHITEKNMSEKNSIC